ncbi:MAG: hypothetical protein QXQ24_08280 [Nitrososphaeria archaeon]
MAAPVAAAAAGSAAKSSVMSNLANSFVSSAGSQIGSGIGGVLGYGIGELFGHNKRARRQQIEQQDKLNALSFQWNKKQMDYAQQLEKQMYQYTFDMNKPEALKNLYKEAGLNPALMYGTSAGGVQGTSVGGGRGAGYNSQAANEAEIIHSNLALQEMGLQMAKLRSEIDVNKSVANRNNADADLSGAKTKTEEQQRDAFVSKLYYDGKLSWLESIMQKLKLTIGGSHVLENGNYNIVQDDEGSPKIYGGFSVPADISTSIFGREIISAVEASEALADNYIANTALTDEKSRYLFMEVMAEIAQKKASAAESKARELQALWQIGEHVNWKTILESGVEAVNTIMNLLGTAYGSGMVKGLSNAPKSVPPRTVINNYNAPRNPAKK